MRKKNEMEVFVVIMRRWGDKEKHSYVIGVYTDLKIAMEQGVLERIYRGCKYEPEIKKIELDKLRRKESFQDIMQQHL